MSTILINYAHLRFFKAQARQTESVKRWNCVDRVVNYGVQHLDASFVRKNSAILDEPRGAGFYLWKPFIILKTIVESSPGDLVLYVDSGAFFTDSPKRMFNLAEQVQIVIPRMWNNFENAWTKRDAFVLMDCDKPHYVWSRQRLTGYLCFVVSDMTRRFCEEWLNFSEDRRIISQDPNKAGQPNYPGYQANRHTQSSFSLLSKKWGLPEFCDPSQWGHNDPLHKVNYPSVFFNDHYSD
jgi:hypothetical protein